MANILGWLPLSARETVNLCRDIGTLLSGFSSRNIYRATPGFGLICMRAVEASRSKGEREEEGRTLTPRPVSAFDDVVVPGHPQPFPSEHPHSYFVGVLA